jgi:hypothetical protein
MDRTVERILSEWREAERERDTATDDEAREAIEARIAGFADAYRRAVEERTSDNEPRDFGGVLGAEA